MEWMAGTKTHLLEVEKQTINNPADKRHTMRGKQTKTKLRFHFWPSGGTDPRLAGVLCGWGCTGSWGLLRGWWELKIANRCGSKSGNLYQPLRSIFPLDPESHLWKFLSQINLQNLSPRKKLSWGCTWFRFLGYFTWLSATPADHVIRGLTDTWASLPDGTVDLGHQAEGSLLQSGLSVPERGRASGGEMSWELYRVRRQSVESGSHHWIRTFFFPRLALCLTDFSCPTRDRTNPRPQQWQWVSPNQWTTGDIPRTLQIEQTWSYHWSLIKMETLPC